MQPLPHVDPPTPALSPTRADRLAPREQVERPEDLVFDDDGIEVAIGGPVTYAAASALDHPMRARRTPRLTDTTLCLVAESTPLGAVLLGAAVGDTFVLRVPGRQGAAAVCDSGDQALHGSGSAVVRDLDELRGHHDPA